MLDSPSTSIMVAARESNAMEIPSQHFCFVAVRGSSFYFYVTLSLTHFCGAQHFFLLNSENTSNGLLMAESNSRKALNEIMGAQS